MYGGRRDGGYEEDLQNFKLKDDDDAGRRPGIVVPSADRRRLLKKSCRSSG